MAVAAFWLALAAVLVANRWRTRHVEAERHRTIRLLIEKEPHVDLEKIKELLYPTPPPMAWPQPMALPPNHPLMRGEDPEHHYGLLRMWGTILMIGAVGLGAVIVGGGLAQGVTSIVPFGAGATVFCFLVGAGLFFSARFVLRGAKTGDQPRDT